MVNKFLCSGKFNAMVLAYPAPEDFAKRK